MVFGAVSDISRPILVTYHRGSQKVNLAMSDVLFANDPTILALRRALDREAASPQVGEDPSDALVRVVQRCLPLDICNTVFLPADGTCGPRLAIAFKPAFRRYLAFAAEYWLYVTHGRESLPRVESQSTRVA